MEKTRIRLVTIVGARPQFIKAGALSRAIRHLFSNQLEDIIIHTGQHFDENMSDAFFREQEMPVPIVHLSSTGRNQGAKSMVPGLAEALEKLKPDAILVYGDTDSTLAGAIAAKVRGLPLVHVEAGLRSWNWDMPEEENRVLTDHLSDVLFCPTKTALDNLKKEGIGDSDRNAVRLCGDVMLDNALFFSEKITTEEVKEKFGLGHRWMILTLHRGANVDDSQTLSEILSAIDEIADKAHVTVVMPVHPRTGNTLKSIEKNKFSSLQFIPPVGNTDLLGLVRDAMAVFTDSGGVQKEAGFFGTPCYIIREETEWVELVEHMKHVLAGTGKESILKAFASHPPQRFDLGNQGIFGDGKAAEHICRYLIDKFS
jgi:UDP-GlcNAc3NAcA epimerase